jgi:hypothetical protein
MSAVQKSSTSSTIPGSSTPWRKHRFPNRVCRVNCAGEEQQVVFATTEMCKQFLLAQKNVVPKPEHKRKQGNYGSHKQDRHLVNR